MSIKLRFPGVAKELGVSVNTARHLARTDPLFPPVLDLGPRTKLVSEVDLLRYIEAKRVPSGAVVAKS